MATSPVKLRRRDWHFATQCVAALVYGALVVATFESANGSIFTYVVQDYRTNNYKVMEATIDTDSRTMTSSREVARWNLSGSGDYTNLEPDFRIDRKRGRAYFYTGRQGYYVNTNDWGTLHRFEAIDEQPKAFGRDGGLEIDSKTGDVYFVRSHEIRRANSFASTSSSEVILPTSFWNADYALSGVIDLVVDSHNSRLYFSKNTDNTSDPTRADMIGSVDFDGGNYQGLFPSPTNSTTPGWGFALGFNPVSKTIYANGSQSSQNARIEELALDGSSLGSWSDSVNDNRILQDFVHHDGFGWYIEYGTGAPAGSLWLLSDELRGTKEYYKRRVPVDLGGYTHIVGFDGGAANPVPEPATVAMWSLIGLCGVGYGLRRRLTRTT